MIQPSLNKPMIKNTASLDSHFDENVAMNETKKKRKNKQKATRITKEGLWL